MSTETSASKNADGIEIIREFAAPPSSVFAAWTTAESFARWFGGPQVDVPAEFLDYVPRPGGTWSAAMVLPNGHRIDWVGDFVEVVPDERFTFTLTDDASSPARALVTVDLAPTDSGTRVQFTQQTPGFAPEQQDALIGGWQSFLDAMADDLAS